MKCPSRETIKTLFKNLSIWVVFSVIIALAPVLSEYISTNTNLDILTYCSTKGEVLVVSTVLAAEGAAEILSIDETTNSQRLLVVGISLGIVTFACLLVPRMSEIITPPQKEIMTVKVIFFSALLTSATCKIIRILEDKRVKNLTQG